MKEDVINKAITFGITFIFIFVAFIPTVHSQIKTFKEATDCIEGDINDWSTNEYVVDLGVYRWPLLDETAMVTAYRDGEYVDLIQRGTRGLGIAGGQHDEIDSIDLHEEMHITFDIPQYLIFFEVRSLFIESYGRSPVIEEGDVDLYYNGSLVYHYHLVAEEQIGTGNGVLNISEINRTVDQIVFYLINYTPYRK